MAHLISFNLSRFSSLLAIIGILLGAPVFSFSQNLVPNGGFEDIGAVCPPSPNNAIRFAEPWYTSYLTPDLFGRDCNIPSTPFWDNREPFEGDVFAGMVGQLENNGTYKSEGMGVRLTSPLITGNYYYLQLQVRNKGTAFLNQNISQTCASTPRRQIGVYLSQDSIELLADIDSVWFTDTYSSGNLILSDASEALNTDEQSEWQELSGCFSAEGGERHLGLATSLGKFNIEPPCQISDEPGFLFNYYLDVDEVMLLPIPFEVRVDTLMCNNRLIVNLDQMAPQPIFKSASFRWEDGSTETQRVLRRPGTYRVDLILPCVTVPMYIEVESSNCGVTIFAPTGFSPNDDGHNDLFQPVIRSDWPLSNYRFTVYDRWGRTMFVSQNSGESWNGRMQSNGNSAPMGVYVWTLQYEYNDGLETKQEIKSGTVTLLQ